MAELTDEEKIVIGVCVGVGGLVLIAVVIILCYICLHKGKRQEKRRRHYVKERYIDEYRPPVYDPLPYPPPPPMPYPPRPPSPRPPSLIKIPPPPTVKIPYTDPYQETDYRYGRWDGVFRNEPIVISLAKPEYQTEQRYIQEPDTIYLKYTDDQALLRSQNYQRRGDYEDQPIRRTRSMTGGRSFTVVKRETPYVGEWYSRGNNISDFNRDAYNRGRDPFLWN